MICMIVSSFSSSQHNLLLLILFSLSFHAYVCLRLHPLVVQKSPMCHLAINETFIQSMFLLKLSHNTKISQKLSEFVECPSVPLWHSALATEIACFRLSCLSLPVCLSTSIYSVLSLLALACR